VNFGQRLKQFAQAVLRNKRNFDRVQGEATMSTLSRARWVVLFLVPLHLVLAWYFSRFQAPQGYANEQEWAHYLYVAHASTAATVLLLGILAHVLLQRHSRATHGAIALHVMFCATYLWFGAVVSYLDIRAGQTAGISTFMMICMAVGVLSLMRPAMSVPMFAVAFGVFWNILVWADLDPAMLPSLQINIFAATTVSTVASLIAWSQYVRMILLRRALSRSNETLVSQQQELEQLAKHDALTGLYNRREFLRLAEMELAQAARNGSGTCLLMADIDFFKKINDQHGHPVGDEVLKRVATRLLASVRLTDAVARMGGEEFIVLLPRTESANAMVVAEKLRTALRAEAMDVNGLLLNVTASFGVSSLAFNERGSIDALYMAADHALYEAKHAGRDRVIYAAPVGVSALSRFDSLRA
jgi:diguanylate cyclase (GGDEF)-like protein